MKDHRSLDPLHGGEIVKKLQYGSCGFIRSFLGQTVYFNRNSFAPDVWDLEEGEMVVFHLRKKFDEKKECFGYYAVDLKKASELNQA